MRLFVMLSGLLAFTSTVSAQETPKWLWLSDQYGDNQSVYLRKEFSLPGKAKEAALMASADNHVVVFLNGKKVASSDEWATPAKKKVAGEVVAGNNVLAVVARNDSGAAGAILRLDITLEDGKKIRISTDESWTVSGEEQAGWQKPAFAGKWAKPFVIGDIGVGPWQDVFNAPPAGESTPVELITTLPGFKVQRLYSVPREQGSWVNFTFDPKGRIVASDQSGPLYRVTVGRDEQDTQVEQLDVGIGDAQGMLWLKDTLYITVNGGAAQGSGFYKVTDTNNDDQLDKVELLKKLDGGGEHGPHGIAQGPDGMLYVIAGNFTKIPDGSDANAPHGNWAEDQLLTRMPDGGGHDPHIMAPGGWVARTDLDGKNWQLVAAGLRNSYDIAFNQDGEMFTYDSDMEWDTGAPWYRPTRCNHLVSGGEYGWRNGSGKWPAYYPDSLPGYDIGYGSPTGVTFGTKAKFPGKYQRAFYVCDWSYGKLYAMHFTPSGASYTASFEPFVAGKPLPLTDVEVGPDGNLYFTIGGRGTQSGLYRVTYAGSESTAPTGPIENAEAAAARKLRHEIEAFQTKPDPKSIDLLFTHLDSPDRNIRYAARVALEKQPLESWRIKALSESRPTALINAMVALARVGPADTQQDLLEALGRLEIASLTEEQLLEGLRAMSLSFIRQGAPKPDVAYEVAGRLEVLFPSASEKVNREVCQLLVFLNSKNVVSKGMSQLAKSITQEDQMYYVITLRSAKGPWTLDERKAYFSWLNLASQSFRGGNSFRPFLNNVRNDAIATLTPEETTALADVLKGAVPAAASNTPPRQFVHNWQFEDIEPELPKTASGRNFERGKAAFEAAQCAKCHRFNGEGGSTGPDLTGAGNRFNAKDMLSSIVYPSAIISDQYGATRIQTTKNQVLVGRIEKDEPTQIVLRTNPLSDQTVTVLKKDIKKQMADPLSMMPEGLISILEKDEVLDLIAYVRSAGSKDDAAFK